MPASFERRSDRNSGKADGATAKQNREHPNDRTESIRHFIYDSTTQRTRFKRFFSQITGCGVRRSAFRSRADNDGSLAESHACRPKNTGSKLWPWADSKN